MGLFDGLFGGGVTQSSTTNPYKNMPQHIKDMLEAQAKATTGATNDASAVRKKLANPNLAVAPLNGVEQAGLNSFVDAQTGVNDLARRGALALNQVGALTNRVSEQYPGRQVRRGANMADRTYANAINMTDRASVAPGMAAARGAAGGVTGDIGDIRGIDVSGYEQDYENPYLNDVVDTTLARFDEDLARRLLANERGAAALGGTTNSRRAVADAVDQQLTTREKGTAEAGLRSDAFDTSRRLALERGGFETSRANAAGSLGLDQAGVFGDLALNEGSFQLDRANQYGQIGADRGRTAAELALDAARFNVARDSAAGQMGLDRGRALTDMANARSARALTEGSYLQGFGEKLRGLDQARLDAPKDAMSWFSSVTTSPNAPTSTSNQVTNSGGNSWAQALGAGLGAYQILSDERAKTGAAPMQLDTAMQLVRELRPSTYEYRPGLGQREGRTAGFMAQDLEKVLPGAVSDSDDGFKRVDPYPVLATLAAAVQDLDRRIG